MTRRTLLAVVVLSALTTAARVPTRSRTPFGWDPVNFALALERLDVAAHRPHQPAAVGYVIAGRALQRLMPDGHLALVAWNLLLSGVGALLVFAIAYAAAAEGRERAAWLAWTAWVGSPLLWLYSDVAEIYVSETVLGLAAAYFCLRQLQGREWAVWGASAALALLAAFRVTGLIFLLPLWAFALLGRPVRERVTGVVVLAALTLAWLVPFLLHVGPAAYARALLVQLTQAAEPTSLFTGASLRQVNRNVRDGAYALMTALGPFNVFALPVFLLLRRPRLRPHPPLAAFAALWALPALLFYVLVHMAKFGYVLPALPVLSLALAFLYAQEPRASVRALLIAGQLVSGAAFFLAAQPATGAAIGEGITYTRKSPQQKLRTELNSLLFPTLHTLRRADAELQGVRDVVRAACPDAAEAVVVTRDGPGPNWRRVMYALPEPAVVRVPPSSAAALWLARGREIHAVSRRLKVSEACATFWVLPAGAPAITALRDQTSVEERSAGPLTVFVTRGSLDLELDGTRLEIRR